MNRGNDTDAMKVLSMAGHEFLRYRGYGRDFGSGHLIGAREEGHGNWVGEPARKNFKADHDIAEAVARQTTAVRRSAHPARAAFGLPNNSYFNGLEEGVSVQPTRRLGENEGTQRRASPLLMHVHCFPNGATVLAQVFLPAKFLPDGMGVAMRRQTNKKKKIPAGPVTSVDARVDWNVVRNYLDAQDAQRGLEHEFPDRQSIWPRPTGAPTL
jgi:hypothetical protein